MSDVRPAEGTPGAFFQQPAQQATAGTEQASETETKLDDGIARATLTLPSVEEAAAANKSAEAKAAFLKIVPQEYLNEEWVQNIAKSENPMENLFKQQKHAQSLVGSRKVEPLPENATPEQRKAFYQALGVPEDLKEYVIAPLDWQGDDKPIAEFLNNQRNPKVVEAVAKVAQEEGVTPKALNRLAETMLKAEAAEQKELFKKSIAVQQDFAQLVANQYGPRGEQVLQEGRGFITTYAPEWARDILKDTNNISNKGLLALSAIIDNFKSQHMREGASFAGTGTTAQAPPMTEEGISTERRKIYADPAWRKKNDVRHADLVRQDKILDEQWKLLKGLKK